MKLTEKDEFQNNVEKCQLGLLDILIQFPSLNLDLDSLIHHSSRIAPRFYTIASSNLKHPNEVIIAISLDNDKLPNGNFKQGPVSRYCKEAFDSGNWSSVNHTVFIKDSNFNMPKDSKTPVSL